MSEPSLLPSSDTDADTPPRRRGLILGAAAAAAVAGAALAWRRLQPHATALEAAGNPTASGSNIGTAALGAEARLWSLTLDTPAGDKLALSRFRGKPLLINFWATWCPPCVAELPLLDRFYRENTSNGWQVLGLAQDQLSAVQRFLQITPVSFPVVLAGPEGSRLGRDLGNVVGGLPFSVVIGGAGTVLHRRMGQVSTQDLAAWSDLR